MTSAHPPTERWRSALEGWAIPPDILSQAPESPWVHPPRLFAAEANDTPVESPSHRAAHAPRSGRADRCSTSAAAAAAEFPLAPSLAAVTGVDEHESMLVNFASAFERAAVPHREVLGRWPDVTPDVGGANVVVCHHVVYNVGDIEPFVRALTDHAGRRVVVELPEHHPLTPFGPLWKHFWDLDRPAEPSAELFVDVLTSLGLEPLVERIARSPRKPNVDDADYIAFVRRILCLGSAHDAEVASRLAVLPPRDDAVVTVWWRGARAGLSSRS